MDGGILCLALHLAVLLQVCNGGGHVELRLVRYKSDGKDMNNECCDFFCFDKCDPMFTICLQNVNERNGCTLGQRNTGGIDNQNDITFGTSIGGTQNPLNFVFAKWPGGVVVKVTAYDQDDINSHDKIADFHGEFNVMPDVNDLRLIVQKRRLRDRQSTLDVEVNVRCAENYYGDCSVHCKAAPGRYMCAHNGTKICYTGWTGSDCRVNIDDCLGNLCQHGGTCLDHVNGYTCKCPRGYTGYTCETSLFMTTTTAVNATLLIDNNTDVPPSPDIANAMHSLWTTDGVTDMLTTDNGVDLLTINDSLNTSATHGSLLTTYSAEDTTVTVPEDQTESPSSTEVTTCTMTIISRSQGSIKVRTVGQVDVVHFRGYLKLQYVPKVGVNSNVNINVTVVKTSASGYQDIVVSTYPQNIPPDHRLLSLLIVQYCQQDTRTLEPTTFFDIKTSENSSTTVKRTSPIPSVINNKTTKIPWTIPSTIKIGTMPGGAGKFLGRQSSNKADSEDGGLGTASIIGVVVGVAVLVALCISLIFFLKRKKRYRNKVSDVERTAVTANGVNTINLAHMKQANSRPGSSRGYGDGVSTQRSMESLDGSQKKELKVGFPKENLSSPDILDSNVKEIIAPTAPFGHRLGQNNVFPRSGNEKAALESMISNAKFKGPGNEVDQDFDLDEISEVENDAETISLLVSSKPEQDKSPKVNSQQEDVTMNDGQEEKEFTARAMSSHSQDSVMEGTHQGLKGKDETTEKQEHISSVSNLHVSTENGHTTENTAYQSISLLSKPPLQEGLSLNHVEASPTSLSVTHTQEDNVLPTDLDKSCSTDCPIANTENKPQESSQSDLPPQETEHISSL